MRCGPHDSLLSVSLIYDGKQRNLNRYYFNLSLHRARSLIAVVSKETGRLFAVRASIMRRRTSLTLTGLTSQADHGATGEGPWTVKGESTACTCASDATMPAGRPFCTPCSTCCPCWR